ncbi:hypothetical protein SESBI_01049 [Sesbania bispinosa]|nr:hypothetical protein SESBI_01049 [Sesbania bispinosa]
MKRKDHKINYIEEEHEGGTQYGTHRWKCVVAMRLSLTVLYVVVLAVIAHGALHCDDCGAMCYDARGAYAGSAGARIVSPSR